MLQDNESDVFSFVRFMDEQAIISVANTGTVTVNPSFSLEQSSLTSGDYFVTDLLTNQSIGKNINRR